MFVSCVVCCFSYSLCDGPITRPGSPKVCACVCVCDQVQQQTSTPTMGLVEEVRLKSISQKYCQFFRLSDKIASISVKNRLQNLYILHRTS